MNGGVYRTPQGAKLYYYKGKGCEWIVDIFGLSREDCCDSYSYRSIILGTTDLFIKCEKHGTKTLPLEPWDDNNPNSWKRY